MLGTAKIDNTMYAIESKSKYGRYDISTDIYSALSARDSSIFPSPNVIKTELYDRDAIAVAVDKDDISHLAYDAIKTELSNIEYNMLFEMPGNVYNDYCSGNLIASSFKAKN